MKKNTISIYGAKEHNLKNIDIDIPRDQLVVITGVSGSGKSSLAFDTIFAEGQRRYIDTLSSYAKQFLGNIDRPLVDKIDGLSPVIAIEQKTTNKNPRSTVGTITEIYDFLRLLYARAAEGYSFKTNKKMVSYTDDQIENLICKKYDKKDIIILSPVVSSRKGHYKELFVQIAKSGYLKVRIDGEITNITQNLKLDRYKNHDIEIVIDRLKINKLNKKRLSQSIKDALKKGNNSLIIANYEDEKIEFFSKNLICEETGISYSIPEPNSFSFNSPKGACAKCNGIGHLFESDIDKIIPNDSISINNGGIIPIGEKSKSWIFAQLKTISEKDKFSLDEAIKKIPKKSIEKILYGVKDEFSVKSKDLGIDRTYKINFSGIVNSIEENYAQKDSPSLVRWAKKFMKQVKCKKCNGTRLKKESLNFLIDNKNIGQVNAMSINEFENWIQTLDTKLSKKQNKIAKQILQEIKSRTRFLSEIGLGYLSFDRQTKTLSGGESQRIRLATQIGSELTNVLYILDEPSIGLHQRDNQKLITSLKKLRDSGNSVIVVEHDEDMIKSSDFVIDIGPNAGKNGGEIIFSGSPKKMLKSNTITAQYINKKRVFDIPPRRKGNGENITLEGVNGNNLKDITVTFPLGKLICVTGVSGSGKSTLVNETLYPILNKIIYRAEKIPLGYKKITGTENIDKVIDIDQSPIGRTPRSNPATYVGFLSDIRNLFANLPESKIRGYKAGRFSFNVKGGRCESCQGAGLKTIEMNFLPDIYVNCDTCNGRRFNRETLSVIYKGKSISDILNMTVNDAVIFFEAIPKIHRKIKTLQDVGLGYITLGQQSTTLSGGEAQRVKLATELSKKNTGKTLFILDEPTTGLHFEDIKTLMNILQKLVDLGNSMIIIEHNLDVIKLSDWIIDVGLEGGENGGEIICFGTPEDIIKNKKSYTAKYLKSVL